MYIDPCDYVVPVICSPLTAWACDRVCDTVVGGVSAAADATGLLNLIGNIFVDPVGGIIKALFVPLLLWLVVPSTSPEDDAVMQVIKTNWILPIVIVFLTCGVIWQGILMTISRKGEPAMRAVKGIFTTVMWGGIAAAGSAILLDAGDRYSCWVLGEGLRNPGSSNQLIDASGHCAPRGLASAVIDTDALDRLSNILAIPAMLSGITGVGVFLGIIIGLIFMLIALCQMLLLVVRGGGLIILVGVSQLAAAGTVTRSTSPWLKKIMAWMLALIMYKPAAATVWATTFLMLGNAGQSSGNELRNFLMGIVMMVLAVIAMPALMRFFTWGFTALGREGTMAGVGTGVDNLGDTAVRVGNELKGSGARGQAESISSSLPQPIASVETTAMAGAGASGGGSGGTTAVLAGVTAKTTVFAPPSGGAAAGAGAGAAAGGAAAAGAATAGVGLVVIGTAGTLVAATNQIGSSVKKAISDHLDEDNE